MDKKNNSIISYLIFVICIFIVGTICSILYIFAVDIVPSLYLSLVLPFLLSMAVGRFALIIINILKMNRTAILITLFGIMLLIFTYIRFNLFFEIHILEFEYYEKGLEFNYIENIMPILESTFYYIFQPQEFINSIDWFVTYGTWTIGNSADAENVRGILLIIVWVVEFLIIFVMSISQLFRGDIIPQYKKDFYENEDQN